MKRKIQIKSKRSLRTLLEAAKRRQQAKETGKADFPGENESNPELRRPGGNLGKPEGETNGKKKGKSNSHLNDAG